VCYYAEFEYTTSTDATASPNTKFYVAATLVLFVLQNHMVKPVMVNPVAQSV
jgi:hypothetical protein